MACFSKVLQPWRPWQIQGFDTCRSTAICQLDTCFAEQVSCVHLITLDDVALYMTRCIYITICDIYIYIYICYCWCIGSMLKNDNLLLWPWTSTSRPNPKLQLAESAFHLIPIVIAKHFVLLARCGIVLAGLCGVLKLALEVDVDTIYLMWMIFILFNILQNNIYRFIIITTTL